MEEYPSLVEGTGLENREVVQAAQGFESLFLRHLLNIAGWSSSVARWAHNPEVVGSNPVGTAICGFIAQSVEQRTENPRVAGSIPAGATMENIKD